MNVHLSRKVCSGVMFAGLGATGLALASAYPMGTASKMGPGYFPMLLSALLVALGSGIGISGLLEGRAGRETVHVNLRVIGWILGSIITFAVLFRFAGLLLAAFATVVVASRAADDSTWRGTLASAVVLTAAVGVLFKGALGLPFDLLPPALLR